MVVVFGRIMVPQRSLCSKLWKLWRYYITGQGETKIEDETKFVLADFKVKDFSQCSRCLNRIIVDHKNIAKKKN